MDKAITDATSSVNKATSSLATKMKQGGEAKEGRLKEAREEMEKLKEPIATALKAIDELRTKASKAKGDYAIKETKCQNVIILGQSFSEISIN